MNIIESELKTRYKPENDITKVFPKCKSGTFSTPLSEQHECSKKYKYPQVILKPKKYYLIKEVISKLSTL
jgi:hypothetical protein